MQEGEWLRQVNETQEVQIRSVILRVCIILSAICLRDASTRIEADSRIYHRSLNHARLNEPPAGERVRMVTVAAG